MSDEQTVPDGQQPAPQHVSVWRQHALEQHFGADEPQHPPLGQHVPPDRQHPPEESAQHTLELGQQVSPPQHFLPDGQHSPPQHVLPGSQHFPPQHTLPAGQHLPLQQVSPERHALSHDPQWLVSVFLLTQSPLQFVWPVGHALQRPAETAYCGGG